MYKELVDEPDLLTWMVRFTTKEVELTVLWAAWNPR
jgi:hypothetical protein